MYHPITIKYPVYFITYTYKKRYGNTFQLDNTVKMLKEVQNIKKMLYYGHHTPGTIQFIKHLHFIWTYLSHWEWILTTSWPLSSRSASFKISHLSSKAPSKALNSLSIKFLNKLKCSVILFDKSYTWDCSDITISFLSFWYVEGSNKSPEFCFGPSLESGVRLPELDSELWLLLLEIFEEVSSKVSELISPSWFSKSTF